MRLGLRRVDIRGHDAVHVSMAEVRLTMPDPHGIGTTGVNGGPVESVARHTESLPSLSRLSRRRVPSPMPWCCGSTTGLASRTECRMNGSSRKMSIP